MILSCFFWKQVWLITWWRRENIFCESPLFNSLSASRTDRQTNGNAISTSVSETIRKPPLPKAQPALRKKYGEKRFSIWRLEFFFPLRFWPDCSNLHAILNQFPKVRQNQATRSGVMTSYTISRRRSGSSILLSVSYLMMSLSSECQNLCANHIKFVEVS